MIEWYWLIVAFGFGVVVSACLFWLDEKLDARHGNGCSCVNCDMMNRMEGYEQ